MMVTPLLSQLQLLLGLLPLVLLLLVLWLWLKNSVSLGAGPWSPRATAGLLGKLRGIVILHWRKGAPAQEKTEQPYTSLLWNM